MVRIIFAVVFLGFVLQPFAYPPGVKVLKNGPDALTFEVLFDEPVISEGAGYSTVTLEGVSLLPVPGLPSVPSLQYQVGVPPGGAKISVSLGEARMIPLPGPLCPVPDGDPGAGLAAFTRDSAAYHQPVFPSATVSWSDARIGNQPVKQIRFSPLVYHPTDNALVFHKRIR